MSQIKRSYPKESTNKNAVIIGLTDGDMYIDKMNWQFAFGYRAENRFAVIATARMNPVNFREPADLKLLASRLRKMITKNIGILYFDKEQNSNPRSVLYDNVMGLEELDSMGEDF